MDWIAFSGISSGNGLGRYLGTGEDGNTPVAMKGHDSFQLLGPSEMGGGYLGERSDFTA